MKIKGFAVAGQYDAVWEHYQNCREDPRLLGKGGHVLSSVVRAVRKEGSVEVRHHMNDALH